MKRITTSALFCAALTLMSMMQAKKTRIIFFGDSITEAGAREGGYIARMKKILDGRGANNYELIGAGIGGNKVYDLCKKTALGTGPDFEKFQRFYVALIKKLREKNKKTILVPPAAIGEMTDCSNTQDGDLNKYSKAIRKMAAENKCTLIDLRKIFLEYNAKNNPDNKSQGILTTDGVHLNDAGNQLTAEEMMKGLGILN